MITEETWRMLDYYWDEKGDVTRWFGWDNFAKTPDAGPLLDALDRLSRAKQTVDLIIAGMRP